MILHDLQLEKWVYVPEFSMNTWSIERGMNIYTLVQREHIIYRKRKEYIYTLVQREYII